MSKTRTLSDETRKKISIALRKIDVPSRFKKGVVFTEEQRARMAEKMKGHKFNLGKHHTEASRLKMKLAKEGKSSSEKHKQSLKGRISPRKGVTLSKETKKKISENKKRTSPRGENHPNWRGGVSFEPYPTAWDRELKELIRGLDGYKCVVCGAEQSELGKRLDVHHIDYNKGNLNTQNLISLCHSCHASTHHNQGYWKEYLMNNHLEIQNEYQCSNQHQGSSERDRCCRTLQNE